MDTSKAPHHRTPRELALGLGMLLEGPARVARAARAAAAEADERAPFQHVHSLTKILRTRFPSPRLIARRRPRVPRGTK